MHEKGQPLSDIAMEAPSDLAVIVQRAILEVAEMKNIEERVTEMSEKISKLTPLPGPPSLQSQAP